MNAHDDWATWGTQWREQSLEINAASLGRRVRRKRWRMTAFVTLELGLSFFASGELVWILLQTELPARIRWWALAMMPFVVITQALLLHIRRGTWRSSSENPATLLGLIRRQSLAGIRLGWLQVGSNVLQALASLACIAPVGIAARWWRDPNLHHVLVVNIVWNGAALLIVLLICIWYIQRQKKRLRRVDVLLQSIK